MVWYIDLNVSFQVFTRRGKRVFEEGKARETLIQSFWYVKPIMAINRLWILIVTESRANKWLFSCFISLIVLPHVEEFPMKNLEIFSRAWK